MDLSTCYCRNRHCAYYGLTGQKARLQLAGWHRGARRLKCLACGHWISARTGTAYAGIRTSEVTFRHGIRQLAEGTSLRATARIIECDKDTVCHWLPRVGRHCLRLLDYFFRDLHVPECQLDELWTFVYKKEKHLSALDKLAGRYGDAWIWVAFDPRCKVVPAWRVGKRTLTDAKKFVSSLKASSLSNLKSWLKAFQLNACILGGKPPIHLLLVFVACLFPGFGFYAQGLYIRNAPIQTLLGQSVQFNFSDIEPTAMLGCVPYLKASGQTTGFRRLKGFIERCEGMGVEVVTHQNHDLRIWIIDIQ